MPNWTDAQLDAIKARRGTVLVSAAAGSGKTAVLVERVIERLADPEHPTDADRLLVVTFTKAAAAEMRDRIGTALMKALSETQDPRVERQLAANSFYCSRRTSARWTASVRTLCANFSTCSVSRPISPSSPISNRKS